jgi:hypothetical protein
MIEKVPNFFVAFLLMFLCVSCGPKYVQDPNAYVLVTSQYENERERIVSSECKPKFDCCEKEKGANCAALLYNRSGSYIIQGTNLAGKNLFTAAVIEYMKASALLKKARIILIASKTENFEDWKIAVMLGLENKIEERIKLCDQKISSYKWRR